MKRFNVTLFNMASPSETRDEVIEARDQNEAERVAISGGLICLQTGWGVLRSEEIKDIIPELECITLDLRYPGGETQSVVGRYSPKRVDDGDVPPDYRRFSIRKDGNGRFVSLEKRVNEGFAGDFLTRRKIHSVPVEITRREFYF